MVSPAVPQPKKKRGSIRWGWILYYLILLGCGCLLITVIGLNVIPYQMGVTQIFEMALPPVTLSWGVVIAASYLFGILIFGMFQAIEVLPNALVRSRASVLMMLDEIGKAPANLKVEKTDSQIIRQLKESLARIPERQVKIIFRLKTIAYFFDGCFCYFIFPPFAEGAQLIGFDIFTDVQWMNVLFIGLTLVAFEQIVHVIWHIQDAERWIKAIGRNRSD